MYDYCGTVYNSKDLEPTQMPIKFFFIIYTYFEMTNYFEDFFALLFSLITVCFCEGFFQLTFVCLGFSHFLVSVSLCLP